MQLKYSDTAPYHGTNMLSKAVGDQAGIAPEANFVVVRMPVRKRLDGSYTTSQTWSALLDALSKILQDISSNNLMGKAVINMSWGT